MSRPTIAFVFVLVGAAAAVTFACGTSSETSAVFDQGGGNVGPQDAGAPVPLGDDLPIFGDMDGAAPPDPNTPEGKCYAQSTRATCRGCCDTSFPDGQRRFEHWVDACICQPSVCAQWCGDTYCAYDKVLPPKGSDCFRCVADHIKLAQGSLGYFPDGGTDAGDLLERPKDGGWPEWQGKACSARAAIQCAGDPKQGVARDPKCYNWALCTTIARCGEKPQK